MNRHDELDASGVTSRYFETGDARLFGITKGDGQPVVFLHGITANAFVWLPIVERLGDQCLAIAPDERGHGRSDRPPGSSYTATDLSGDVAGLVEHLERGPAIVVGHSLGARNAITAAHLWPEHVRGIVAIEFGPYIEQPVFDRVTERVKGGDRAFDTLDEAKEYLQGRYALLPPDAIERRATYGFERTEDGKFRALADPAAMAATSEGLREDVSVAFASLDRPALIVRGAESPFISQRAFERMTAARPDFAYEVVPGADHYVPEIAPDTVAGMVARFIDEVG